MLNTGKLGNIEDREVKRIKDNNDRKIEIKTEKEKNLRLSIYYPRG